jgi:hypothetical protein
MAPSWADGGIRKLCRTRNSLVSRSEPEVRVGGSLPSTSPNALYTGQLRGHRGGGGARCRHLRNRRTRLPLGCVATCAMERGHAYESFPLGLKSPKSTSARAALRVVDAASLRRTDGLGRVGLEPAVRRGTADAHILAFVRIAAGDRRLAGAPGYMPARPASHIHPNQCGIPCYICPRSQFTCKMK